MPNRQRAQPSLERPYTRNGRQHRVVAQRRQMRNAEQCLDPDGTIPVQLPDRLHVPDVGKAFLRQIVGSAVGAGHCGGLAGPGTTPERVASTRDMAVQIGGNLKPIVAVVLTVHDPAGDFVPDAEPCWTVLHSERIGKTSRVSIREIEADQHHLSSAGELSKDFADLAHCLAARSRIRSSTTESLPGVRATMTSVISQPQRSPEPASKTT